MLSAMVPLSFPKATEAEIQKSILEYLKLRGYLCWRNNSGMWRTPNKNHGERVIRFGKVGSGDILGMKKNGTFFSVEVKAEGKNPTKEQSDFIEEVTKNFGLAFIARSVDDVIAKGL